MNPIYVCFLAFEETQLILLAAFARCSEWIILASHLVIHWKIIFANKYHEESKMDEIKLYCVILILSIPKYLLTVSGDFVCVFSFSDLFIF